MKAGQAELTAAEGVCRLRPQKLVHVLLEGNVHWNRRNQSQRRTCQQVTRLTEQEVLDVRTFPVREGVGGTEPHSPGAVLFKQLWPGAQQPEFLQESQQVSRRSLSELRTRVGTLSVALCTIKGRIIQLTSKYLRIHFHNSRRKLVLIRTEPCCMRSRKNPP